MATPEIASRDSPHPSRLRALLAGALLTLVSIAFCLAAIEAALRIAPAALLPAGGYGSGVRNDELGMNVYGTPVLYTKNGFVRRIPNRDGFLDVDHERVRPPGVARIGVFGDSYVEAMQVPLESTFFRQAETRLGASTEWLAFGISGWGTLHAFRAYTTFASRYDLEAAVYLFVENDLGDNDEIIKSHAGGASWGFPVAALSTDGTGYDVRWPNPAGSEPTWFAPAKWVQRHSLLAQVALDRLELLRRRGVRTRSEREQREMSSVAGAIPDMTDLPSTWPADARARVETLGALILRDWKRAADDRHIAFLVLYVPRGDDQLRGALPVSDTWLPWLADTCRRLDLPLVDPSPALRAALDGGEEVYSDHWTPAGHRVVAAVLADAVRSRLETSSR